MQRDPSSTSSYMYIAMTSSVVGNVGKATVEACLDLCCHDWSCESFAFLDGTQGGTTSPGGNCTATGACCIFKDDVDALVANPTPGKGVRTGVRSKLPARPPPYPASKVAIATVDPHMQVGINGDEFPITWGADGSHLTGAGDNHQTPDGTPEKVRRGEKRGKERGEEKRRERRCICCMCSKPHATT